MPRRRWCSALIVLTLAVALPGAPLTRIVAGGCKLCAASCPMHQRGKPKCHAARRPRCHGARVGIAPPGCGPGRADPLAVSIAYAIPSRTVRPIPLVPTRVVRIVPPVTPGRAADPPDTPPPIVSV